MRVFIAAILVFSFTYVHSQERSKKLIKSVESTNPDEYQRVVSDLKRTPEEVRAEIGYSSQTSSKSKEEKSTSKTQEDQTNQSTVATPVPANTSAIAHGEASRPTAAVAKIYKYKADEKSVDYYNDLRKKFEVDEKARKEKEAQLAIENSKKEEEIKQGRRLTEDKAPQFDRFRQGEKNQEVKRTTAEEDYKNLFK